MENSSSAAETAPLSQQRTVTEVKSGVSGMSAAAPHRAQNVSLSLPSFRQLMPVRRRPSLFGGGNESNRALSRRIRWVSMDDAKTFATLQRQIQIHFRELCHTGHVNPDFTLSRLARANAIVVSEDFVPTIDPMTGRIVHSKPLMPPNMTLKLTGFVLLRVHPASPRVIIIDAICSTPARSQAKSLLTFILRKAIELGFLAVRFGETQQTLPLLPRNRPHAAKPTFRREHEQNSDDGTDTEDEASQTDTDEDDDEEEEEEEEEEDTSQRAGGAARHQTPQQIQATRAYNAMMRYLENQSVFKPKIGGHLIQFLPDMPTRRPSPPPARQKTPIPPPTQTAPTDAVDMRD